MPEPGTYQTRISDYRDVDRLDGDATLAAYGELYGRVQRQLFAAFAAGRSVTSLKGEYLEVCRWSVCHLSEGGVP